MRANDVLVGNCRCLEAAEARLTADIARIRQSSDPPARQQRQIPREQQIATGRRMTIASWFDLAVVTFNLSRPDEARHYAKRVEGDAQFGARARELLAKLRQE